MSDESSLLLVVAALYFYECLSWPRIGGLAFLSPWLRGWRTYVPFELLTGVQRGPVLANPLPPLGRVVVAPRWPISISPHGAFAHAALANPPAPRDSQTERFESLAGIIDVAADGPKVFVHRKLLVTTSSPTIARDIRDLLVRLAAASPAGREKLIRSHIASMFDLKALADRLAELEARTRSLRWVCNALFVLLFIVAPLAVFFAGVGQTWIALTAALAVLWLPIAVVFAIAHRRLYPGAGAELVSHFTTLLLLPPAAIRACDRLWLDGLARFHPLALAHKLLNGDDFREFAENVIRDVRTPIAPTCPRGTPLEAREIEGWFRDEMAAAIERFVRACGLDPAELLTPPAKDDPNCIAYCPRCRGQFVVQAGTCISCGGLPLVSFPQATA